MTQTTTIKRLLAAEAPWRRRIPIPLLRVLVAARTALAWRNAGVRNAAILDMRFLLDRTRPHADVETIAQAYVREMFWRAERRWRPELVTSQPVEGVAEFLAARDPDRGVVLTFTHHGVYDGAWASLDRVGIHCHAVAADFLFHDGAPAYLAQHLKVLQMGATLIPSDQGSAGIRAALEHKAIVAIAPDFPGKTPVHFAGRDLVGSFGAARLAYETNSPVVISTSHRAPEAPARIRLHPVLEPRDFPDATALLAEILRRHEAAQLEWPEATDRPAYRWGLVTEEDQQQFGELVKQLTV